MLNYLELLEAESITVLREVAAQFERPVILYSVGKDSSVLVHLARKAFAPGSMLFPLLHIDTGFKFPEMYGFRDRFAAEIGASLLVHRNQEAIAEGANPEKLGTQRCCGLLKTHALLTALGENGFDAAIGGARRDEERSRAKERIFSFRDRHGQWDPRNQRPELWNLYNGKIRPGESIRVFPLSNWTELDIWHYIYLEHIPIVPLYLAATRPVVERGGQLLPVVREGDCRPGERMQQLMCRFRTLGCSPCTAVVRSDADTVLKIIEEMFHVTTSERVTRVIDYDGQTSMETRKREGYF